VGCSPIVREPNFAGAATRVTDVTLIGPFDGQVIDESTSEPLQGATVVGVWSYDRGDGFIAPYGSEVVEVKTDQAGRYRIPRAKMAVRGAWLRLVAFELVVYKRGYVAYRSDSTYEGGGRTDFTLRHNKVKLRKWREADSHAAHLLFLAAPPQIEQLSKWERERANVDLYRELGGAVAGAEPTGPTQAPEQMQLLDALALLTPEEVRRRTGYTEPFDVKELGDLARTHFYHGVHLEAIDRDETFDVAYRVWKAPPGGLATVQETFEATLPGVKPTAEITPQTWIYDGDDVRAVAFLDTEADVGVLLTCGAAQCADIETAIILAKFLYGRIDQLALIEAPSTPRPAGTPAPGVPGTPAGPKTGPTRPGPKTEPKTAPGTEPAPKSEPKTAPETEPETEPETTTPKTTTPKTEPKTTSPKTEPKTTSPTTEPKTTTPKTEPKTTTPKTEPKTAPKTAQPQERP
jgi:hypothetical protein